MGLIVLIGAGSFSRTDDATLSGLLPSKACLPVIISYSTAPTEKRSDRASASRPFSCSGAMYWNVPTTVPCAVKGSLAAGVLKLAVRLAAGLIGLGIALAKPKSISLVPLLVNMMLPGLISRW